jgi:hypothetical protein
MKAASRQRWALSFADLCLLLLGFFVMLQARPNPGHLSSGFRAAFGTRDKGLLERRADALFEPGEAILTRRGGDQIVAFAQDARDEAWIVSSRGTEAGSTRFDGWELAAARTAAVARALQQAGVAQERIAIAIDPKIGGGQTLAITRN